MSIKPLQWWVIEDLPFEYSCHPAHAGVTPPHNVAGPFESLFECRQEIERIYYELETMYELRSLPEYENTCAKPSVPDLAHSRP